MPRADHERRRHQLPGPVRAGGGYPRGVVVAAPAADASGASASVRSVTDDGHTAVFTHDDASPSSPGSRRGRSPPTRVHRARHRAELVHPHRTSCCPGSTSVPTPAPDPALQHGRRGARREPARLVRDRIVAGLQAFRATPGRRWETVTGCSRSCWTACGAWPART
ncbi:hypothetical protein HBB16_11010 [Pseudonocardia sp. MCCB 268]|nr:hypothetical protein [Pseudonocardia cytotoxica]